MASRKGFLAKSSYILGSSSDTHFHPNSTEGVVELEEGEVWNLCSNTNPLIEAKKGSSSPLGLKRGSRKEGRGGGGSSVSSASGSQPVNIPDWSKILKEDYQQSGKREGDRDGGGIRIPPHEYLARTRGASSSVHEGIGRTLKGRDLRSVRNAVWKKVGFED